MEEITIEQVMERAKEFQNQGKKWHFHMLTPDCMFNVQDKQAFVLENVTDSHSFVVYSDTRYMEQGQKLVKMLHGEKILDNRPEKQEDDAAIEIIVEKAKKYNERGISWHHHMLFPHCIFNKHTGKWCIVFEDKEENKIIDSLSEHEPKENLNKVEVLYYAQKS